MSSTPKEAARPAYTLEQGVPNETSGYVYPRMGRPTVKALRNVLVYIFIGVLVAGAVHTEIVKLFRTGKLWYSADKPGTKCATEF